MTYESFTNYIDHRKETITYTCRQKRTELNEGMMRQKQSLIELLHKNDLCPILNDMISMYLMLFRKINKFVAPFSPRHLYPSLAPLKFIVFL